MAEKGGGGYSINPASTGAQGLEQYFDNQNKSQASGYRAPIINIATGGSKQNPAITAQAGNDWTTWILVGGGLIGLYLWKSKS
jgi:hypothetical protein